MVDLSVAARRQLMTPSGVQRAAGASATTPTAGGAPTTSDPSLEAIPIAMLNLDSSLTQPGGQPQIPWQYLLINLFRLAQPTGVTPGTVNGVTVNANGQVVNTQSSGATIDSPTINDVTLTGSTVAPTPAANDNSTAIATTAWVNGFVTAQNFVTHAFLTAQNYATQSYVHAQGFITDAPADGNVYARQNGTWVVVTPSGGT